MAMNASTDRSDDSVAVTPLPSLLPSSLPLPPSPPCLVYLASGFRIFVHCPDIERNAYAKPSRLSSSAVSEEGRSRWRWKATKAVFDPSNAQPRRICLHPSRAILAAFSVVCRRRDVVRSPVATVNAEAEERGIT